MVLDVITELNSFSFYYFLLNKMEFSYKFFALCLEKFSTILQ